jgi:hypothetical protein
MALWGKTDNLAGKPKYVARKCYFDSTAVNTTDETINLANANTNFATGDAVYYSINGGTVIGGLVDATVYYVRRVTDSTISLYSAQANAISGGATNRLNITGAGVGTHILQKTLSVANTNDGTYPSKVLMFIDQAEAMKVANKAKGVHGGGWYLYSTYTDGNGNTRHKAELLAELQVLAAAAGDDNNDDSTIGSDVVITIGTQPQSATVVAGEEAEFSVAATISTTEPAETLAYQWQVQVGGTGDWVNIAGETSTTFTIDETAIEDDTNKYRVVITSSINAITATSNAATLTVTAE